MAKALPVFMDSFQYEYADILKKWTAATTAPSATNISNTYGRVYGERGIGSTGPAGTNRGYYRTLPGSYATVVFGAWIYTSTVPAASDYLWVGEGSALHVGIRGDGTGKIGLYRNGTIIGSLSTLTVAAGWHWYECKVTINDSGTYEVRVDGTTYVSGSGDTRNAGSGAVTSFGFFPANSVTTYYVTPFCADATDVSKNDFLGQQICTVQRGIAAGTHTDFASSLGTNFAATGDMDVTDGSFVQSSTTGAMDTYTPNKLPSSGGISGIQHVIVARTDGSTHTLRPVHRISGTDYHDMTAQAASGSYTHLLFPSTVSPASASAYTQSELDAAEPGFELVS